MFSSARFARTSRSAPRGRHRLDEGQLRSDFKEALIVVLLWLAVCGLAGLWTSPAEARTTPFPLAHACLARS